MFPLTDDNPTFRTAYVTLALIVVNTAVMLWLSLLSPRQEQEAVVRHGFIPHRIAQLTTPNLVLKVSLAEQDPPARGRLMPVGRRVDEITLLPAPRQVFASLLTTMFMHGGWMHLLGNMWFLWVFGNNIEERLGHVVYLIFYLVGGLLATACHWAHDPTSTVPVIGASGAVATILGAYAVTFPKARVRTLLFYGIVTILNIPAIFWLGLWLLGQFVSALVAQDLGVAVWAHIGGFAAGALLMPILSHGAPPPGSTWEDEIKKHFSFTPPDR